MDLFQGLQNMLGGALSGRDSAGARAPADAAAGLGGLGNLLTPEILGGIASALFANKSGVTANATGGMGGALGGLGGLLTSLIGGGAEMSFPDQQHEQAAKAGISAPQFGEARANPQDRSERMLRALVYAAKADGHIDDQEQAIIAGQLKKLNVSQQGQAFVQRMINEPLDPRRLAQGVADSREAMQLYAMSVVATNADHPMEQAYLDQLASELRLPAEVKAGIDAKARA